MTSITLPDGERAPLPASPRVDYYCPECGSREVRWDAYACWDSEHQQFELQNMFEDCICDNCGEEITPREAPEAAQPFTCIFQEVETDAPPVYDAPLVYLCHLPPVERAEYRGKWVQEAQRQAMAQRRREVDFKSTLSFVMAFAGDLSPAVDAR